MPKSFSSILPLSYFSFPLFSRYHRISYVLICFSWFLCWKYLSAAKIFFRLLCYHPCCCTTDTLFTAVLYILVFVSSLTITRVQLLNSLFILHYFIFNFCVITSLFLFTWLLAFSFTVWLILCILHRFRKFSCAAWRQLSFFTIILFLWRKTITATAV